MRFEKVIVFAVWACVLPLECTYSDDLLRPFKRPETTYSLTVELYNVEKDRCEPVQLDKDGEPILLPSRVYRRIEPRRPDGSEFVFDITDEDGRLASNPRRYLAMPSTVKGEWLGGKPGTFYSMEKGTDSDGKPTVVWQLLRRGSRYPTICTMKDPDSDVTIQDPSPTERRQKRGASPSKVEKVGSVK